MRAEDSRVLVFVCAHLPSRDPEAPRPLSLAEWYRIATCLREAGLARPGDLRHVGGAFWETAGLEEPEAARLQALLARGDAWEAELERLAARGIAPITMADPGYPERLRKRLRGMAPPVLFGA